MTIRFLPVTLRPPEAFRQEWPAVSVWAVAVREETPPPGVAEPLDWLLLTTVAVRTAADALERVDWSICRWVVEVWHKVLTSGCSIEQRQLASAANLQRALAVYSVIAAAAALPHAAGPRGARRALHHVAGSGGMAGPLLCHPQVQKESAF